MPKSHSTSEKFVLEFVKSMVIGAQPTVSNRLIDAKGEVGMVTSVVKLSVSEQELLSKRARETE